MIRPLVSVIIPTLNEAATVASQAATLSRLSETEIIFVDGGSTDSTAAQLEHLAAQFENVSLCCTAKGRANQMNCGAARAKGEWLIFLHADTLLPEDSFATFLYEIKKGGVCSGAFTFKVGNPRFIYRYLEFYVAVRAKHLRTPFGDQAIFVRRNLFEQLGGYRNDFPLMEDMELVQRLKRHDGFQILNAPVYTSARRYEADGYFKRTCGNLYLQLLYKLGVHPAELAAKYYRQTSRHHIALPTLINEEV